MENFEYSLRSKAFFSWHTEHFRSRNDFIRLCRLASGSRICRKNDLRDVGVGMLPP